MLIMIAEILLLDQEIYVVRGSSDCKIVVSGSSEEVYDVIIKDFFMC